MTQFLVFSSQFKTVFSLCGHSAEEMHSDTTSCPVIDLRIITSDHMSKIFRGLGSTVTPQVHLPVTQTFSHAHLLHPGVWWITYVLWHVSDIGQ
jgi:hypothetical protein